MVKAILDGRKTQTRRLLKKQPIDVLPMKVPDMWVTLETRDPNHGRVIRCRYGVPHDRLWVRETWAHDDMDCKDVGCGNRDHIWWKANETKIVADSFAGDAHWRPSIHMPRWASRITLEIVNIRVERVQEISGDQCTLEGIQVAWSDPNNSMQEKMAFKALWDSINAKRGYGWDVNPWVWVIEFKRVK